MFNALHGTPGEDGTVQGMMDLMGLRYTHSGLETSVIAIDKELTKMVLVPHGIRMPAGTMVESESLYEADPMARPYVLKPVNEGSSVGVAIVTDEGNYGDPIGRDERGAVAAFRAAARRALHPRPRADRGGARRRGAGGDRAPAQVRLLRLRRQIYRRPDPARLPGRDPGRDRDAAMAMALEGASRCSAAAAARAPTSAGTTSRAIDGLYLLEINTQPGMTPLSLVPEQARYRGMSYAELVQRIVEEAL